MVRMLSKSLIKDSLGSRYYGAAVFYAVTAYVAGFVSLFGGHWAVGLVGTLLLAHGMIIAAYLIHECDHNMVFNHSRHNAYLGRAMSWLCGAAYGTCEDMNLPFYRLPALHAELTGDDPQRIIPFSSQLKLYHRNRVHRIYNPQPEDYPKGEIYLRTAQFGRGPIGGNAASFLTSF